MYSRRVSFAQCFLENQCTVPLFAPLNLQVHYHCRCSDLELQLSSVAALMHKLLQVQ